VQYFCTRLPEGKQYFSNKTTDINVQNISAFVIVNIQGFAHRKKQKIQRVILFNSTLTHSVMRAISFFVCLLFLMCKFLNVVV